MLEIKKITLQNGYYFSPGFYIDYWRKCIDSKLSEDTIYKDGRLKQYREMFLGAHIAAMQTKLTGLQYFVGLPADEPPDVDVVRFSPSETKSGKKASNLDTIRVEITRCDMNQGETVIGQILKKNKQAYKGMSLAVHTSGSDKSVKLEEIHKLLEKEENVYPREIIIIGPVLATKHIKLMPGTYSVSKVWPDKSSDLVYQLDSRAFFRTPEVITTTGRGASREAKPLGFIELLPPTLS